MASDFKHLLLADAVRISEDLAENRITATDLDREFLETESRNVKSKIKGMLKDTCREWGYSQAYQIPLRKIGYNHR